MITSTTGNTAVRLPPHRTAMTADVKMQATTLTRWARASLSARLKLCMGRSSQCSRDAAHRRLLSLLARAVELDAVAGCSKWRRRSKGGRMLAARTVTGFSVGGNAELAGRAEEAGSSSTGGRFGLAADANGRRADLLDSADCAADTKCIDQTACAQSRSLLAPRDDSGH